MDVPRGPRVGSAGRSRFVVIAAILALAIAALASQTAPWRLLEARAFDFLSTTLPPARPAEGPLIIAIDEPSFAEIGLQWPWPRSLHAQLIAALRNAGVRAIGVDIIFAEPSDPAADDALAGAIGPDIVLAADEALIEGPHADQLVRVEPLPELLVNGGHPGVSSIVLDGDGTLRRIPAYDDGFARRLLEVAESLPAAHAPGGALIQAYGPARSYETVSYYQALDPSEFLPPGHLIGRVAIIGLSLQSAPTVEAGGADAYATSFTPRTGRLVSGAEIQATIFDNLAAASFIRPASLWVTLTAIAAATLASGLLVCRGTGWQTIAAGAATVLLIAATGFISIRVGRLHVPTLAPGLAFLTLASAVGARDFAAERRLRRFIAHAFSQYLDPAQVRRLAADPSGLKLGGERKTLTVLFSDVRGFTTIAESMKHDPERLTGLINRLLDPLSEAILAHGGTIDKYMGDAVMAFWNAPLDDPDHALHAVQAAIAMVAAIEPLNAELAREGLADDLRFKIGVGINSGDCIVGNMGSRRRFDYTAIGDAVNLASRLEGQTKEHGVSILLGEETAALIHHNVPLVEVASIRVKGKTEAVTVYTISDV